MNSIFRALRHDEIECRVAKVTDKGCQILLYKDARCDMNILDEAVGVENWQARFYEQKGILFCSLGINVNYNHPEKPERWIWKDDAGAESNVEEEKGNASDARKRAGFAFGIGRELYTAPFIWIKREDYDTIGDTKNPKDRFTVDALTVEDGVITGVEIVNASKRKSVFRYEDGKQKKILPPPTKEQRSEMPTSAGVQFNVAPSEAYCCEGCGKVFESATYNGREYSAQEIYESAKRQSGGAALCKACRDAREAT